MLMLKPVARSQPEGAGAHSPSSSASSSSQHDAPVTIMAESPRLWQGMITTFPQALTSPRHTGPPLRMTKIAPPVLRAVATFKKLFTLHPRAGSGTAAPLLHCNRGLNCSLKISASQRHLESRSDPPGWCAFLSAYLAKSAPGVVPSCWPAAWAVHSLPYLASWPKNAQSEESHHMIGY